MQFNLQNLKDTVVKIEADRDKPVVLNTDIEDFGVHMRPLKKQHNPYKSNAAWIAVIFVAVVVFITIRGNPDGASFMVYGGCLGALIGISWERGKG